MSNGPNTPRSFLPEQKISYFQRCEFDDHIRVMMSDDKDEEDDDFDVDDEN